MDEDGYLGWADEFLPREATNAWKIQWAHSGSARMEHAGWRAIYEASRTQADGTCEGALIQALVEVGAIPYRERYQPRHA